MVTFKGDSVEISKDYFDKIIADDTVTPFRIVSTTVNILFEIEHVDTETRYTGVYSRELPSVKLFIIE